MLDRARRFVPQARYEKMRLQEMGFEEEFEGATCIDAMEHVSPEDWPVVLRQLRASLEPGGVLYLTVVRSEGASLEDSFRRAQHQSLPVVPGEVADAVEESFARALATPAPEPEDSDKAAYHFYPAPEQVRRWIDAAGLVVESEGAGLWYSHLLLRRRD